MKRFVEGEDRRQGVLLPEYLDDFVAEENQVRVIEAFVDELDLGGLGFEGVVPEATGRPAYHSATMLKIYVYGYVNQIASSRRLEREARRNVELMWLTGRLAPDFKTIADFRKDNGAAIRATCQQFVALCRKLNLFPQAMVAIDGSRFLVSDLVAEALAPPPSRRPRRPDRRRRRRARRHGETSSRSMALTPAGSTPPTPASSVQCSTKQPELGRFKREPASPRGCRSRKCSIRARTGGSPSSSYCRPSWPGGSIWRPRHGQPAPAGCHFGVILADAR
jgi:transposase